VANNVIHCEIATSENVIK